MSNFLNFAGNQGTTFKNHGTGGGTSFTLNVNATTNSVLLAVGGVLQAPGTDFTVSGTTVTTTTSVTSGIEVLSWVIHKPGTAPVIQDNSVTGGKIALTSQAEGDIMYCNSSGDWVRLAIGTAGQIPAVNSGATAPEWVAGPGMTLIDHTTISAVANVDFNLDATKYREYLLICSQVVPATDGTSLWLRFSTDGGSTFDTANYVSQTHWRRSDGIVGGDNGETDAGILLGAKTSMGTGADEYRQAVVHIYSPEGTTDTHVNGNFSGRESDTRTYTGTFGGWQQTDQDVDAIRVLSSSGNLTSGELSLYGFARA